jgi:hypothetical protein
MAELRQGCTGRAGVADVDLIYHAPIALHWPGDDLRVRGIYWLRVYRDSQSAVVIFTDIPANQGPDADFAGTELARLVWRDHLPSNLTTRWFYSVPGRESYLPEQRKTRYYESQGAIIAAVTSRRAR